MDKAMNETIKQLKATKASITKNRRLREKCEKELMNTPLMVPADKGGTMMKANPLIRQIQDIDKSYIELCKLLQRLEKEDATHNTEDDFTRYRS
jgi:superfamily II helicase